MKTTHYQCFKCKNIMKFEIRNVGKLPSSIGCISQGCDGRSIEMKLIHEKEGDADGVFFRPDVGEWDVVKTQLKFEASRANPKLKISKLNKIVDNALKNFRKHVSEGGLVFLPKTYFKTSAKVD